MVSSDGDPDDWTTSRDSQQNSDSVYRGGNGNDDREGEGWVEAIRNILIRIRMELSGIL